MPTRSTARAGAPLTATLSRCRGIGCRPSRGRKRHARGQRSAGRTAGSDRPLRRNRFRQSFFDEYLDPGLQESRVRIDRKAVVRNVSVVAGHAGRSPALAIERQHHQPTRCAMPPNPSSATWTKMAISRHRWKRSPPSASTRRSRSKQGLRAVQSLDPAGVGARNLRECLLLQIESVNGHGGVAWQIVSNCLRLWRPGSTRKSPRCWAVRWSTSKSPSHDPAPQSAAGPALFRRRGARGGAGRLLHQGRRRLHHSDERRGRPAASSERPVPQDARSRERRHQGSPRLRARALHIGHPADEEYRAAQADHPESLPGHRAAPDRIPAVTAWIN